jgi:hypothetical protein
MGSCKTLSGAFAPLFLKLKQFPIEVVIYFTMTFLTIDILSTVFSFLPFPKREELGISNSQFALAIKQTTASKKELADFRKMRRAAFFHRHLGEVRWRAISANELLPVDFFRGHEDKVDWNQISANVSIPAELIEKHIDEVNWTRLASNETVPLELFAKHMNEHFQWYEVVASHPVNPEILEKNLVELEDIGDDKTLTATVVNKYLEWRLLNTYGFNELFLGDSLLPNPWPISKIAHDYDMLQFRKFSVEWLEANLGALEQNPHVWSCLCSNENIPIEFLEHHLDKIDWSTIMRNKAIPIEFFEKHVDRLKDMNLDWAEHGIAPLPIEFFEKHGLYPDWGIALLHCTVSRNFLERYIENLDWDAISGNDSVPIEFLEEHIEKINWTALCLGRGNIPKGFVMQESANEATWIYQPVSAKTYHPWPERS